MNAPARTLTVLSADDAVVAACREAAERAGDAVSEVRVCASPEDLAGAGPVDGVVVVDPAFTTPASVHEWTLDFLGEHRALLLLLTHGNVGLADGLARFVGAQGALPMPLEAETLADRLRSPFGAVSGPRPEPEPTPDSQDLAESIAEGLQRRPPGRRQQFLSAVADAETGLHTPEYWEHRLDEEFKRANRFRFPLGLVSLSWEGEVDTDTVLDLASVILVYTRDVDVACRIALRSFVVLLPHTGARGAETFAERVLGQMRERGHRDLLEEPLELSSATAVMPDSALGSAREFLARVLPEHSEQPA